MLPGCDLGDQSSKVADVQPAFVFPRATLPGLAQSAGCALAFPVFLLSLPQPPRQLHKNSQRFSSCLVFLCTTWAYSWGVSSVSELLAHQNHHVTLAVEALTRKPQHVHAAKSANRSNARSRAERPQPLCHQPQRAAKYTLHKGGNAAEPQRTCSYCHRHHGHPQLRSH